MKEILKNVARFVELSKEFTISDSEAYEGFTSNTINWCTSRWDSNNINTNLLKVELYEKFLQDKIGRAKRYEEYLELRKNLGEYFNSVDKLNK